MLRKEAHVKELVAALGKSKTPLVTNIICDILGDRHSKTAVPALISALKNGSPHVRASAADALAKIGDSKAGAALYDEFISEEVIGVQHMLALALGAVCYGPAIPLLVQALQHADEVLRGCAAWSLGTLRSKEAKEPLQQALAMETHSYAKRQMKVALEKSILYVVKAREPKRRAEEETPWAVQGSMLLIPLTLNRACAAGLR
jgi:HEAT repeat protein